MAVDDSSRLIQPGGRRIHAVAFLLSMCICAILCLAFLGRGLGPGPAGGIELATRINPNDAPPASMARLSGIGESRAAAIVAYRNEHRLSDRQGPAFRDCNDLQNVKGIGPITVQKNRRWLKFD